MTIARSLVCVTVAAGLLAACSKPAGPAGSAQAAASAAPASGPDTVISENDLPHPKGGEWLLTVSADGSPPVSHRDCESGERIDVKPKDMGKNCSQFSLKRTFLGALVMDATCTTGPVSYSFHLNVHGDFNNNYVTDSTGSVTMQGQPTRSFTSHTEAHYLGPCTGGEG